MAKKELFSKGSGEAFKFAKVGDSITGVYLGYDNAAQGKFGPQLAHKFKTQDGIKIVYNKLEGQLADLLAQLEPGQLVEVIFDRTKDTGKGNPMKIYRAILDDSYVADPADVEAALSSVDEDANYVEPVTAPAKARPAAASTSASKQAEIQARLAARRTG